MVIIKRGQLAFEPIDAVEKKLVSIGGDDEARGHRKTGGCQSDEIAPPAAGSRYKAALRLIEVDGQTHKATPFQSSTRRDYGCGEGRCAAVMDRKFNPIYVFTIGWLNQPSIKSRPVQSWSNSCYASALGESQITYLPK